MLAAQQGEDVSAAEPVVSADEEEEVNGAANAELSPERIAELGAAEEYILTLTEQGFGKRSSAYDYRRTGRGGQGLTAHDLSRRGGRLVASFPVENGDEILLVTDGGQLIRVPASQIRIAGRNTQGVTIFRTDGERVVSVERLAESESGETTIEEVPGEEPILGGEDLTPEDGDDGA
jgi:DNA gyrase subunit A